MWRHIEGPDQVIHIFQIEDRHRLFNLDDIIFGGFPDSFRLSLSFSVFIPCASTFFFLCNFISTS
jgi:hypothetical protein